MLKLLARMKAKDMCMAIICALFVMGQIYFDLALPDYMSELTVLLKTPGSVTGDIWNTGMKMLACALASGILCVICSFLAARTAAGFSYTIREEVFRKVTDFGQEELFGFSVPSLITRTTNDITQVQMVISMGLQLVVKAPVMAVWAIIKIVGKSYRLSVITGGFAAAVLVFMISIMLTVLPKVRRVQKQTDDINRIARENLNGINVVHAFNAEEYQNAKFEDANAVLTNTQLFNQRVFALMQPVMGLAMNGLALTIYWVGASIVNSIPAADMMLRITTFSDVIVFSTYATHVVMSFSMLVMIFMFLPAAQVSANRINEILRTNIRLREGAEESSAETGTVEFRSVSFRYPSSPQNQLTNISFKANKGETVAFIGATGSGKTTLISLIARFYDATEGEVLVDGVNVKDYTFDALYNRLGYITQKAVLFAGSIKDNVTFGECAHDVTENDVYDALDLAQASEFVNGLPEKADAPITQSGRNVSGGQKQRLSIARALARKPEIIIFDDSFSALDYKTDAKLRAGLSAKLKGTTCLIVAQRIGTIRHADKIIVLDDGCAVGIGTHDELMQSCSVYREIAMSQLSADELNGKGA